MSKKISYSRGWPYGAPQVMLRGGGTRNEDVKDVLKAEGFRWDSRLHAWTHYMYAAELREFLIRLRDELGCEIVPKDTLDPNYIIDLIGD